MPNGTTKGFTKISELVNSSNVNVSNVDKYINTNVNNVTSNEDKQLVELLNEVKHKPEALAQIIAEKLSDTKNLNFHIKTAKLNNAQILFEALALVLEANQNGMVRTTPAKYCVGILKRKGVRW